MAVHEPDPRHSEQLESDRPEPVIGIVLVTALVAGAAVLKRSGIVDRPALQTWFTVFQAVCLQAFPFLVLGTALGATIAEVVPTNRLMRFVPTNSAVAVPFAGVAGGLLPGCECGSVPIAGRLIDEGLRAPVAFTFMLAAPAINPVVLIATSIAFPGQPRFVVARFLASLATACIVGWIWAWRADRLPPVRERQRRDTSRPRPSIGAKAKAEAWVAALLHDTLHAGGYLVVGAAVAATMQTIVPRSLLESVGGQAAVAVIALGVLAVLLSVCSEADAFVATSFTAFSPTARLAFLVVGPAIDFKLIAMQGGTFGRAVAVRLAPLIFVTALVCASVVGLVLL